MDSAPSRPVSCEACAARCALDPCARGRVCAGPRCPRWGGLRSREQGPARGSPRGCGRCGPLASVSPLVSGKLVHGQQFSEQFLQSVSSEGLGVSSALGSFPLYVRNALSTFSDFVFFCPVNVFLQSCGAGCLPAGRGGAPRPGSLGAVLIPPAHGLSGVLSSRLHGLLGTFHPEMEMSSLCF